MNELTIIMYHYVRNIKNSPYENIKGLETDGFKRQLDYLNEYYNIINVENLIDYITHFQEYLLNLGLINYFPHKF
jgi:hypothetical protein